MGTGFLLWDENARGGGGGGRVKTAWKGNGKAKPCCNQNYLVDEEQKQQHMQTEQNVCPGSKRWSFRVFQL